MRHHRFLQLALAIAGLLLTALLAAPTGSATGSCPHRFGSTQQLLDVGGGTQDWTVTSLKKSKGALPGYSPVGQLWEADVSVRAAEGAVTPLIPNLQARGMDSTYPVLWQVATVQGLPGNSLEEGEISTGKVYFDITGADPMAVVYAPPGSAPAMMWCCSDGMRMTAQMMPSMESAMKDCPCHEGMSRMS